LVQWIKGHSEDRGNDAADERARRGAHRKPIGPEPILPIPASWYKGKILLETLKKQQQHWSNTRGYRQTKLVIPQIDPKMSAQLIKLSRNNLRMVTGILTGHCNLNKHMFIIGITDSPLCRACRETDETVTHVLLECNAVAQHRAAHLGTPVDLREVMRNAKALCGYLKTLEWLE
jgi:hypothetical protein